MANPPTSSTFVIVPSIAALRAKVSAIGATNPFAWVESYYGNGPDGGGGLYIYNSTSTATDDSGVVITPVDSPTTGRWIRDYVDKPVSAAWYGMKGGARRLSGSGGCSITSGTNILHSSGYTFTSADVGKIGAILGAGAAGVLKQFKIASASAGNATITNIDGTSFSASTTVVPGVSPQVTSGLTVFGFDALPAIQAAIDFALYGNGNSTLVSRTSVYIPSVTYIYSAPWQVDYGYAYSGFFVYTSLEIFADAVNFFGVGPSLSGAFGYKAFADAPGIAVNSARGVDLTNIGMMGMNYDWIVANALGQGTAPPIDDVLAVNWVDPQLPATANSRHAPSCMVGIDCYAGTQPVIHYPNRTYPSWTGFSMQYSAAPSSTVRGHNCQLVGDVVGVAVQPADVDANGDFISFEDSQIGFMKTVWSAGNTQGRCMSLTRSAFTIAHTCFATNQNGRQSGKINGVVSACDFGEIIRVIDCTISSYGGPLIIEGCSGEEMWQLGIWTASSSGTTLTIRNSVFSFELISAARGLPPFMIKGGGGMNSIVLDGLAFGNFLGAIVFVGDPHGYSIQNILSVPANADLPSTRAQAATYNFTCGHIMFEPQALVQNGFTAYFPNTFSVNIGSTYNLGTAAADGTGTIPTIFPSQRAYGLPAWSQYSTPGNAPSAITRTPNRWTGVSVQSLSGSVTARTLTVDMTAGWTTAMFALQGGRPGDVFYDTTNTTLFRVTNLTTTVVTASIMNGYRTISGTTTYWNSSSGTFDNASYPMSGNVWQLGNSRIFSPINFIQGDLSTGSATVSNVGNALGVGTTLDIVNGDYLYRNNTTQADVLNANSLTSSVTTGSPGSFALSSAPAITQVRSVFQYFARVDIPNE